MHLFDIVDKSKWFRMQEGFSKVLGACIQTVDPEGKPLPGLNKPNSFCLDLIRLSAKEKGTKTEYEDCIAKVINKLEKNKLDNYYTCPYFGLYLYGIAVKIKEQGVLAHIIIGPILVQKKKDISEYKKIAEKRNIPLDHLMDMVSSLKKFSFIGIEAAIELLQEVANDFVQLNYDTKRLKARFNIPAKMDDLIKELYSSVYFDELLNALLEASLHTTKSHVGSIMLMDQRKDELAVKFSRGLKDEMVKKVRVKMGEGISGIVAKNKKPLLIDDSIKDIKIKNRLKRPHIKSSIVYPLELRDRVFGVLNVNNTDSKKTFDSDTLDLIGQLTRLTNIALGQFPEKEALQGS